MVHKDGLRLANAPPSPPVVEGSDAKADPVERGVSRGGFSQPTIRRVVGAIIIVSEVLLIFLKYPFRAGLS